MMVVSYLTYNNNKPKAPPYRVPQTFYLHTHLFKYKKTHKQDSKKKAFNLQPLWIFRDLAQYL